MELIDNCIQLFFVFVCGGYSCFQAVIKKNYNWLLIMLFYLSFGIGLAYWVLYLVLFGTTPMVFFVSELSWTASYIFLAIRIASGENKQTRNVKTKPIFLICPAFSFVMCIIFCLRGSYIENVLMASALAACGFFAVRGIYFAKQKNSAGKPWVFYAVLFFYSAEYMLWISSYFLTDAALNPYFLTDTLVLNLALIMRAFAQSREDKICHTA